MLKLRDVVMIDIANDKIDPKDYKPETDPKIYHSEKTGNFFFFLELNPFFLNFCDNFFLKKKLLKIGRGPLKEGWQVSYLFIYLFLFYNHYLFICLLYIFFSIKKKEVDPVMCAYKLVTLKFKVFGLESMAESYAGKVHKYFIITINQING
mgnify:CR=1 FL=1